ncbi:MAG: hypothetical protein J6S67_11275 [Methanobrevibacter sp.]|nr:hypothetical protein [Methanobrevibacter sp.]
MTNEINSNGIQTEDINTIVGDLETGFRNIYGQDSNFDQSTPDGQMINIFAQSKRDTLELATGIYNMFNPVTVRGVPQDNLYKLVGLRRKASQYSYVSVKVTTTDSVSLQGLDSDYENPDGVGYTVSDNNGNNWILLNSTNITGAGSYDLDFRSKDAGAVESLPNTITNMVTILAGVSSVNNPSSQYTTGDAEETGLEFYERFEKSRALSSMGTEDALEAQLLNLNLVESVKIDNNATGSTDAYGTAAHTIWVIVEGGSNAEIGQVIYANVTDGVGMRGNVSVSVPKLNGGTQVVLFDRPTSEDLYLTLSIKNAGTGVVDQAAVKKYLADHVTFGLYEAADTSTISSILRGYSTELIPYDMTIGDGNVTGEYLLPTNLNYKFVLSEANITITTVT